ncbi:hypothetical protein JCM8097_008908 [Rhodosporidiobolus ruineniae]
MVVLVTSLASPNFGPLASSPSVAVTTSPYSLPSSSIALTALPGYTSSASNHSGGGPALLPLVLGICLGSLVLLAGLWALGRWASRPERRHEKGEDVVVELEEPKKEEATTRVEEVPTKERKMRHLKRPILRIDTQLPPRSSRRRREEREVVAKPPPAYFA